MRAWSEPSYESVMTGAIFRSPSSRRRVRASKAVRRPHLLACPAAAQRRYLNLGGHRVSNSCRTTSSETEYIWARHGRQNLRSSGNADRESAKNAIGNGELAIGTATHHSLM